MHVEVGLPLEGDTVVGAPLGGYLDQPFDDIPQIEEDDAHLEELCRMDALMVDELRGEACLGATEEDAEKIHGGIVFEGQVFVAYDFHRVAVGVAQTVIPLQ